MEGKTKATDFLLIMMNEQKDEPLNAIMFPCMRVNARLKSGAVMQIALSLRLLQDGGMHVCEVREEGGESGRISSDALIGRTSGQSGAST